MAGNTPRKRAVVAVVGVIAGRREAGGRRRTSSCHRNQGDR